MVKNIVLITLILCLVGFTNFISITKADWPPLEDIDIESLVRPLPSHPTGVEVGAVQGDQLWVYDEGRFFHSVDSGRKWSIVKTPQKTRAVGLQVSPDNNSIVLISSAGKLFRSDSAGHSWRVQSLEQNLLSVAAGTQVQEYGFGIDKAIISSDFNHMVVIASCQVFVSNDMARTWRNVAPPSSYVRNKRDYCVYDVILDAEFEAHYLLAHMTGSIATDEYVLRRKGEQWSEFCSFGISSFLLKSVANCSEISAADELTQFYRQSEAYRPELEKNFIDQVFVDHHSPISKNLDLQILGQGLSDVKRSRSWVIDHRGVAVSKDQGQTWLTQLGGVGRYTKSASLSDGTHLALSNSKLYVSRNEHLWESYKGYEEVRDLLDVSGGALIANSSGITLIRNVDELDSKLKGKQITQFFSGKNSIWAHGAESLSVTHDGGETWSTSTLKEQQITDWICRDHCISLDYFGARLQSARSSNGGVEFNLMPVVSSRQDFEVSNFWHSIDLKTIVVSAYLEDSEHERYWLSNDGGQDWMLLSISGDELGKVIFPEQGLALAASSSRLYRINSKSGKATSTRLPGYIYNDSLCSLLDKKIILEVEGTHPELSEEESLTFFSENLGEAWSTIRGQFEWSEACNE